MTKHQILPHMVGNTPLVYLRRASELTGCEIFGKAEFLNPGGSVKDRTALGIIREAEAQGTLQPGGVIVEGTAGNTGIGLTVLANALGYQCVVVMPQSQSREKAELLDILGADLILVPSTSYDSPNHYIHEAQRVAETRNAREEKGVIWAQQFDNLANRNIHCETTGVEIWDQTEGKVDGFICSVGTGGTLAGVSMALKERNKDIKIGLADPHGSAIYDYFSSGELKAEGSSIIEGIGISFLPGNLKDIDVDFAYKISDEDALPIIFDLTKHEGLYLGGSSAINIAGAMRMAEELGPGHTIVTILCDDGGRYQSKLYNLSFLLKHHLPTPSWM